MSAWNADKLKETSLFRKTYGCVIGGAIGDAMGGPVEGMDYLFLRSLHGGPVAGLMPYERPDDFFQVGTNKAYARDRQAGTYTDDTYLQLFLAQAIIKKGGRITADDMASSILNELDTTRVWFSSVQAWEKLKNTNTPARDVGIGSMNENSSPMCIGPIGVINACDPAQAALDAYDVSSVTNHGYPQEAAAIIASAVAEAMNRGATVDSVLDAGLRYLPNRESSLLKERAERAISIAEKSSDTEQFTEEYWDSMLVPWFRRNPDEPIGDGRHSSGIDPLESIPCVLGLFAVTQGDYSRCVTAAASFGRDCDTIACMCGYVCGALGGIDNIPTEWVATVLEANPQPRIDKVSMQLTKTLLLEKDRQAGRLAAIEALL